MYSSIIPTLKYILLFFNHFVWRLFIFLWTGRHVNWYFGPSQQNTKFLLVNRKGNGKKSAFEVKLSNPVSFPYKGISHFERFHFEMFMKYTLS